MHCMLRCKRCTESACHSTGIVAVQFAVVAIEHNSLIYALLSPAAPVVMPPVQRVVARPKSSPQMLPMSTAVFAAIACTDLQDQTLAHAQQSRLRFLYWQNSCTNNTSKCTTLHAASKPLAPPSSNWADVLWNRGSTAKVRSNFLTFRFSTVASSVAEGSDAWSDAPALLFFGPDSESASSPPSSPELITCNSELQLQQLCLDHTSDAHVYKHKAMLIMTKARQQMRIVDYRCCRLPRYTDVAQLVSLYLCVKQNKTCSQHKPAVGMCVVQAYTGLTAFNMSASCKQ